MDTDTLRISYSYFFSTSNMVTRRRLAVTLIHTLPALYVTPCDGRVSGYDVTACDKCPRNLS
jgi:hypothetical protein